MLSYKLAKELKDLGYPQDYSKGVLNSFVFETDDIEKEMAYAPDLSELIEACGGKFGALLVGPGLTLWTAKGNGIEIHSPSKEEAVAHLWLVINKK